MTEPRADDQNVAPVPAGPPATPSDDGATPAGRTARPGWPARLVGWIDRRAPRIAAVAAVGYAVAGTGYAVGLGDRLRYLDERVYVALARDLVAGRGYTLDHVHPTAYRPPGYPFLLAGVDAVGGGILAMRLLGVAALAGLVWLAYRFGVLVSGRVAGALGALLTAGYPLLVFTADTLYPQVHAAFLLLFGLYLGIRGTTAGRTRWVSLVVAGTAFGVLVLAVPTFGPSVLAVVAWLGWRAVRGRSGTPRRVALAPVVVLAAVAAVLPAAWCARNAVRLHAFVPVSTNNGVNLLLGNSAHATTGGGRVVDISAYEDAARARGLSEVQQDAFYRNQAVEWIRAHPGRAAALYAGKVVNNFSFRNDLATSGQETVLRDAVSAVTFYPLLALFVLRIAASLRRRRAGHGGVGGLERLLVGLVLGNVLLLAVFYTRLRFRVPLDAVMIVSSAAALADLLARAARRAARRPARATATGVAAPADSAGTGTAVG